MDKNTAKAEIERLSKEISKYNDLYYINNQSEISDYDFDMLLESLIKLRINCSSFSNAFTFKYVFR